LAAAESELLDELLDELLADALPAPDPAPVSAYATADPLARAAPTPMVTTPAPSHAYGWRLCLMAPPVLRPHRRLRFS
jgi:hypothetical protein